MLAMVFTLVSFLFFITVFSFNNNFKSNSTLASIFAIYFSLLTFPGILIGYFVGANGDGYRYIDEAILIFGLEYFLISIGLLASAYLTRLPRISDYNFTLSISTTRALVISIPFICVALYYIYVMEIYKALGYALKGDILSAYYERTQATNALARGSGTYSFPFIYCFPMFSIIFSLMWLRSGRRINRYLVISILFFSLSALYTILLVQKYYLAQMLLFFLFAFAIEYRVRVNLWKLLFVIILGVIVISAVVIMYVGYDLERLITVPISVLERVFMTSLTGMKMYLEYYHNHPLLLGYSFQNPLHVFPYEVVNLPVEVSAAYELTGDQMARGVVGSTPTNFGGEMLVNFGYLGVVFTSLMLGFFVGILDHFLRPLYQKPKAYSVGTIVIVALFALHLGETGWGSIFLIFHYATFFNLSLLLSLLIIFASSRLFLKRNIR